MNNMINGNSGKIAMTDGSQGSQGQQKGVITQSVSNAAQSNIQRTSMASIQ